MTGVLVIALLLTSYPVPQQVQATFNIPDKSLFVKSQLSNRVPPPLRIVEESVLKSNRVPSTVQAQTLATMDSDSSRDEIIKHKVKQGDTLSSIAEKFDLSLNTILWANDLTKTSTIQPGQELTILPVDGVLYSVKSGDTVSEIAQIYDTEVDQIVNYNQLESKSDVYAGDLLMLPGGEQPSSIPAAQSQYASLPDSYFIFPIQGIVSQGPHGHANNAVDVANNCGTPVVAAAGGTVQRAGRIRIGGNRVTILHPYGVVTYYGHLSSIAVTPGQEVSTGDFIGRVGNTGYTLGPTGCHIHFAVRGAHNFLSKYQVGDKLTWQ